MEVTEKAEKPFSKIVSDANVLPDTGSYLITAFYTHGEDGNLRSVIVETTNDSPAEVVYELKMTVLRKQRPGNQSYKKDTPLSLNW